MCVYVCVCDLMIFNTNSYSLNHTILKSTRKHHFKKVEMLKTSTNNRHRYLKVKESKTILK